jgi:hypothetical protein
VSGVPGRSGRLRLPEVHGALQAERVHVPLPEVRMHAELQVPRVLEERYLLQVPARRAFDRGLRLGGIHALVLELLGLQAPRAERRRAEEGLLHGLWHLDVRRLR